MIAHGRLPVMTNGWPSNQFTLDWVTGTLDLNLMNEPLRGGLSGSDKDSRPKGFRRIWTDSRTTQSGDLFIALSGDRFDGHEFLTQAVNAGARGLIIEKSKENTLPQLDDSIVIIGVESTLNAYRSLAKAWREQFDVPVCVIAGSVGKTTTKDLLVSLLSKQFSSVLATEKSENGFIGIPKTLLRLNKTHEIAVIEVGIDEVGAMQKHLNLVQPDIGIVTAISEEHLEKLMNMDQVTVEEGSLLNYVYARTGKVVLNLDEPRLIGKRAMVLDPAHFKGGVAYTLHEKPAPHVIQGTYDAKKKTLEVSGGPYQKDSWNLPIEGEHNVTNLVGAIAMSHLCGVTPQNAKKGLADFKVPFGRMEIKTLSNGVKLIADYYNSSPQAVRAAIVSLRTLSEREKRKRLWVGLGDMLELGPDEEIFHRRLAHTIAAQEIDRVVLLGERMKWLHHELKKDPDYRKKTMHFESHAKLAAYLKDNLESEDILLLKGSRGMRMEKILDLMNFKESDLK